MNNIQLGITVTQHPIPAANHASITPAPKKSRRKLPLIITGVAALGLMLGSCGVMATPKDGASPAPAVTQTVTAEAAPAATTAPSTDPFDKIKANGSDVMTEAYLKTVREQHPQVAGWTDEALLEGPKLICGRVAAGETPGKVLMSMLDISGTAAAEAQNKLNGAYLAGAAVTCPDTMKNANTTP
ncbi:hypothetical protein SALGADO_15 [Arthrobacter phage Salgado]|uniref:DUF732 domain-containing protein n=3 Tax=Laroyevirus TaxID=1982086 RepID=A0A0U4IXK3_9CAUD|nr:hypothetical protein FDH64_gp15 [Arthrobacter phage Laroye]YP_010082528.1 hypothetical protein KMD21_gp15 [Arthrobacter phage LiSara]YP_010082624.1 hypothetical protein KMD22_gp15 [Arthrobacter phage Salgado]ALY09542.1 hypothetical protein LAROYE_15 [Arthrobacter phage Laroye]ALY10183.1 hypothetical protein SALGADO_15 [Arthrobacter phage Salgado]ASR83599.1 hypothetical protein SEA_LISARA_15 [Arthrobacter phage LiSara]